MLFRQGNPRYGPDASDPVRLVAEVAAVLSLAAGVIHISAAGDHTGLPVMFVGFLVVAVLQIALGVLLLWRPPSRLVIGAAVTMTLTSIGLWLISRTWGLPFEHGEAEAVGFKDGITKLFEAASIPPLLLLLSSDLGRMSLPSPRLARQTLTAVGMSCFALMIPALVLGSGESHSHGDNVAMEMHEQDGGHAEDHDGTQHSNSTHRPDGQHEHVGAAGTDAEHAHTQLASSTLGGGHVHTPVNTHAHSEPTDADGGHEHGVNGQHHRGHRERDKQHGHDHNHGEHGDDTGAPDAEPAISVSYEPEPSVCIGGALCVP